MLKGEVNPLSNTKLLSIISAILFSVTFISFIILTNSLASAESSTTSNVSVSVPVSCNITNTKDTPHTATINPGTYKEDIGTTTFKVFCNDNAGYSIYAIGYSNEEYGNTNLIPTNTTNPNIITGTATTGNTSNWSMKLNPLPGDYAPTIENNFSTYRTVPDIYTKVATLTSSTDFTIGSTLQSTYKAYIQSNQPADTYTGKVKYTLVHPASENPKDDPRFWGTLDTGQTVNQKLKRLAGNSSATTSTVDNNITALVRSDTLPSNFTPTTENTISTTNSRKPIYAWYDSSNKTIYYYSEATTIKMNQISSYFFRNMRALSDLSTISSWDTSSVTTMSNIFSHAGYNATTFTLDLSSWNTSSVTNMSGMFSDAGQNATTFTLDLSSWDTSKVTDMYCIFCYAGFGATTWSIGDLSSWDTSSVTNMSYMFYGAGYNATTFTLDLSSWNTSSVTSMTSMFHSAGYSATTWSVTIPKTNKGNTPITNTTERFYGSTTSVYTAPSLGKTFTLAN